MEVLFVAGPIILIVLVIMVVAWHLEKKRTEALQKVAASLNFSFAPQGDSALLGALAGFHLFTQGHSRKARNVMSGSTPETELTIFDYRYTVGHGKNSQTHRQTVLVFRSAKLQLPGFALRPENILHKIGSVFGYQDIDFPNNPEFSRRYLLRADDESAVRAAFGDGVLGFYARHPGLSTEAAGDQLAFYRTNKHVKPDQIQTFMEEGFGVFGLFSSG
ncbi:MAG: hypothetical protein JXR37_06120 [Kiritimatiellae bacterium]|nr:hypothetical protein [Kiritimatiellia bacterium]